MALWLSCDDTEYDSIVTQCKYDSVEYVLCDTALCHIKSMSILLHPAMVVM